MSKATLKNIFFAATWLLPWMPLVLQAQMDPRFSAMPPPPQMLQRTLPVAPPPPGFNPQAPQMGPIPNVPPEEIDRSAQILDFWFGFLPRADYFPESKMTIWFASVPEVDQQIRSEFSEDVIRAERGEYNHWRETPRGRLALILLLDQFPRHIYRDRPQQYALDRMAQALVLEGIRKGDDKRLYPIERAFFYLPLEHSEDLQHQNLSIASYRQLVASSPEDIQPEMQDFLRAAITHQQQIVQFGRFPHRNATLGRESRPEEKRFLIRWGNP